MENKSPNFSQIGNSNNNNIPKKFFQSLKKNSKRYNYNCNNNFLKKINKDNKDLEIIQLNEGKPKNFKEFLHNYSLELNQYADNESFNKHGNYSQNQMRNNKMNISSNMNQKAKKIGISRYLTILEKKTYFKGEVPENFRVFIDREIGLNVYDKEKRTQEISPIEDDYDSDDGLIDFGKNKMEEILGSGIKDFMIKGVKELVYSQKIN